MGRTQIVRWGMVLTSTLLVAGVWWSVHNRAVPPRLSGTWNRLPEPVPPPGAPVPLALMGDQLIIDDTTLAWQRGSESLRQPFTVVVEDAQVLLVTDIDQDGTVDRVAMQGEPGKAVDAYFSLSFGYSYGRWRRE